MTPRPGQEIARLTPPDRRIRITPAHDMDGAACLGLWDLFDSTDPVDHLSAKRLCRSCPVLAECGFLSAEINTPETEGTWAGHLMLRRRSKGRGMAA